MVMQKTLSKKKRSLFLLLTLFFPLLFFVLLEGGLRFFDYGDNLNLFVPTPDNFADTQYLAINQDVARRYFTQVSRTPLPVNTFFLKNKPANGYRIFMLGGSTVAGWPYSNNVLSSRLLNQRLTDAFPGKQIEVVNTGIAALNSHSLLDFMDEVLEQKPDAIMIYAGHNEFYGALGAASTESLGPSRWIIKSYLAALNFKTVLWVRDVTSDFQRWLATLRSAAPAHSQYATLMGEMIGEQNVVYNGATYRRAKQHYQQNLEEIFERAHAANVPVIISELVSNVRDHAPFVSVATDRYPSADIVFRQAQVLEAEGQYGQARAAYYRAKDLDVLRFRAPQAFNEIIRETAAKFNVPVVPMQSSFEKASPNGLIGANLMLEHLHPTVEGYALIANAFFDSMQQHRLITAEWPAKKIKPPAYYAKNWPVTDLDRAIGMLRTMKLMDHWPFTPPSEPGNGFDNFQPGTYAEEVAYRLEKNELNFVQAHSEMAQHYRLAGKHGLAFREYQALIKAAPHHASFYLLAAKNRMEQKRFEAALVLIKQSLTLKNSALGNKWTGQIMLHYRRFDDAVSYLKKAQKQLSKDAHLVYLLASAYALSGHKQHAHEALIHLQTMQHDFAGIPRLEKLINNLK